MIWSRSEWLVRVTQLGPWLSAIHSATSGRSLPVSMSVLHRTILLWALVIAMRAARAAGPVLGGVLAGQDQVTECTDRQPSRPA